MQIRQRILGCGYWVSPIFSLGGNEQNQCPRHLQCMYQYTLLVYLECHMVIGLVCRGFFRYLTSDTYFRDHTYKEHSRGFLI